MNTKITIDEACKAFEKLTPDDVAHFLGPILLGRRKLASDEDIRIWLKRKSPGRRITLSAEMAALLKFYVNRKRGKKSGKKSKMP